MAINKPEIPSIELPEDWGGTQTPYTEQQTQEGYPEAIPTVVDGGNLNYEKRGIFQNIKYLRVFSDWLRNIPIGKIPVVNSQGQLDYDDPVTDSEVVHKTGNETINDEKTFTSRIMRKCDFNAGGTEVISLNDNLGKGKISTAGYYTAENKVYFRHQCQNTVSGKYAYLDITVDDNGVGAIQIGGNATNVTPPAEDNTSKIPTTKWVRNTIKTESPAGRNIGDIFYTSRTDTELNGAVECNGGTYSTSDFTGSQSIGNLLSQKKVPYVSLSEYASIVSTNGSCRAFGWDGGTSFRVPLLKDVYIEAGTAESSGEFISESLPNINTTECYVGQQGNGWPGGSTDSIAVGEARSYPRKTKLFNASEYNSTYKNGAKVKPDSVRYRAMVQLAIKSTDEAVITATSALQQIGNKAENNLSNVSSVASSFKEQAVSWGMPDYSAGVSWVWNSENIAPCDGLVMAYWYGSNNNEISITIGKTSLNYVTRDAAGMREIFPISKGDTFKASGGYNNQYVKFFPFKGVKQDEKIRKNNK